VVKEDLTTRARKADPIKVRIFVRPGPSGLSRLNGIFHRTNRSHIFPDNGSGHATMQDIIFGTSTSLPDAL